MRLQGCRILIVEDNYLIADQMVALISKEGATVCGPCPTATRAMYFAVGEKLDGAVLDVRLGDGTAVPIAKALRRRHVPFIVSSGHGSAGIPREMRRAPFLAKPVLDSEIVELASRCFAPADARGASKTAQELLDLAFRLRGEVLALTGNSGVTVMVDILTRRLRAPSRDVVQALLLAERKGWLIRKGQGVRLTELGRSPIPFPSTTSLDDDP